MLTDLHGLVIPAIASIFGHAPTVQHHLCTCGVTQLRPSGVIKADQTQTTLDHVQRVPISRLWRMMHVKKNIQVKGTNRIGNT